MWHILAVARLGKIFPHLFFTIADKFIYTIAATITNSFCDIRTNFFRLPMCTGRARIYQVLGIRLVLLWYSALWAGLLLDSWLIQ